jgi:hypothetical protein
MCRPVAALHDVRTPARNTSIVERLVPRHRSCASREST